MNIWGERFAEVSRFMGHCKDLNVDVTLPELERYERIGAMLPVARVVYPDEYVIQRDQNRRNGVMTWDGAGQWPKLDRLLERASSLQSDSEGLSDEELVHCFDREMEAGDNPHLIRPELAEFRPWSEYRVEVPDGLGNSIMSPTAQHYYSYWQVHQLSWIQQYPDLWKNAWVIKHIPEDDPVRELLPRAPENELLVEFHGKRRSFDALSFWITLCERERNRTLASVAEVDGVRMLDDVQTDAYRNSLVALAWKVKERFELTPDDLYSFLRKLIDLYVDYRRKERNKLAETLKEDIFAWEDLITLTTGGTSDDVADELGKMGIKYKQTFRQLDLVTKEFDYALDRLNRASAACGDALRQLEDPPWSFTEADAKDLLNYCEREGLGLFMTALSGMVAIGDEEFRQKFRRVQQYTSLKNVLTSYEYLLRSLIQDTDLVGGKETLTQLVDKVMALEAWHKLFDTRKQSGLLNANSTRAFLTNLGALLTDKQLEGSQEGYWAKQFLVTCLARNMTVHSYPNENSFYGDLFGRMLHAVVSATFYTWRHAKVKGWT